MDQIWLLFSTLVKTNGFLTKQLKSSLKLVEIRSKEVMVMLLTGNKVKI
jgi:hypothetical protein